MVSRFAGSAAARGAFYGPSSFRRSSSGRRTNLAAKLLTRDEARRITANIAKPPKAAVVAGQLLAAPVSRSFAGFRWCTAQTVALYFTLSGAGNFRSGSAGLELIERQPASPLPRSGLDHCERSRLPTRAFSQQPPQGRRSGFSLALSQAIPEPPLPAAALVRRGAGRLLHRQDHSAYVKFSDTGKSIASGPGAYKDRD